MATDLRTGPEPSVTALVTGIISDAQDLFRQQLALFKEEVTSEFHKAKEAAISSALGVGGDAIMRTAVHTRRIVDPLWGGKATGTAGNVSFAILAAVCLPVMSRASRNPSPALRPSIKLPITSSSAGTTNCRKASLNTVDSTESLLNDSASSCAFSFKLAGISVTS